MSLKNINVNIFPSCWDEIQCEEYWYQEEEYDGFDTEEERNFKVFCKRPVIKRILNKSVGKIENQDEFYSFDIVKLNKIIYELINAFRNTNAVANIFKIRQKSGI